MLLDEEGILNIDEAVFKSDSYQKIMADNVVTDEELQEQTQVVVDLLNQAAKLPEETQVFIEKLLVETSVLSTISLLYNKQLESK